MIIFLLGSGIYLSFGLKFIQIKKLNFALKYALGSIFKKNKNEKGSVSPFQAVSTALAATVGTGNIAGVAGAIISGGAGSVFWMWISAIFGMATKYAEVVLSVRFRERNSKGDYVGGPMYYIKNGLGNKWSWLASLFCIFGALAAFGIGNMAQVNTISSSINDTIKAFGGNASLNSIRFFDQYIPKTNIINGILIAVLSSLIIFGGIKRIGTVAEKLVPFMALIYIGGSAAVIIYNHEYIIGAFRLIFKSIFKVESVLGAAFGIGLKKIIACGFGRGIFSNEAGLGSAPMAHSASSENDPVKQGMLGIFEVFADTIVICTLTALVLLTTVLKTDLLSVNWGGTAGVETISFAFSTVFGEKIASLILMISICIFAFSSVISWSLYGSRCFEYLFGTKYSVLYKSAYIFFIVIGAVLEMKTVWELSGILNGLMAIPNLIAVLGLSGTVFKLTEDYFKSN